MVEGQESINLNPKSVGLVVAIPFCGRPVAPEWALSLAGQNYPLNTTVAHSAIKGWKVDDARNYMVKHAQELASKYIWFVDDDTAPPFFAVRRLIYAMENADEKVMVAGGIYSSKCHPSEPIVYKEDGQGAFWKWKRGEVFDVASVGTGCMLVRTELFSMLEYPWFKTEDPHIEDAKVCKYHTTDDLYFCRKVREAGFKLIADGGVLCVHWDGIIKDGKVEFVPYLLPEDSYPMRKEEEVTTAA